MKKETTTATEKNHFSKFIQCFAPNKNLKDRWMYFCQKGNANAWTAVEPWKFWDFDPRGFKIHEPSRASIQDIENNVVVDKYKNQINEIVVVACGNATPLVETMGQADFYSEFPGNSPIECVISFVPGKLVMVCNHDGGSLILYR